MYCEGDRMGWEGAGIMVTSSYVYLERPKNMKNSFIEEIDRRRRGAWAAFGLSEQPQNIWRVPPSRSSFRFYRVRQKSLDKHIRPSKHEEEKKMEKSMVALYSLLNISNIFNFKISSTSSNPGFSKSR
ncbi:hypothetical protein Y032_0681g1486 [Ancylostoma ceylanicum]|uniref:Uncharacterized protein n=1 Tax=Ancylostoma ceylanicum TaxID=53326 RepID=A0A016WIC7_9BILA|nr:hypothetical protein Y032_0681g1486 [Ancylostoma ceylanicum]